MSWLCVQVRDQLPHLKAIVQYTGKLSQEYENTYDVSAQMITCTHSVSVVRVCVLCV